MSGHKQKKPNGDPVGVTLPGELAMLAFLKAGERDWRGDCYLVAFEFFVDAAKIVGSDRARLVHGTPVRGGKPDGERIGHAWVEIECDGGVVAVFDLTYGPMPIGKHRFYECGCLNEPAVTIVKYEIVDVLARIEKQIAEDPDEQMFHLGPWDERVAAASHTYAPEDAKERTA